MEFEEVKKGRKLGKIIGYVVMYFVFTTVLYFVLKFFNKLPENWGYFYIVLVTLFIVLFGTLIKLILR